MESSNLVVCELKGIENSNPEILFSFPPLNLNDKDHNDLIPKFLPFGSKISNFYVSRYSKYNILSYIFKIKNDNNRDNLVSLSALIKKRENAEIFKPILKLIVNTLDENHLLTEDNLEKNLALIYKGINDEQDIVIENISISISKKFEQIKSKLIKDKPKLKGSFL